MAGPAWSRRVAFLYTGLRVRNLRRSVAFYRGLGFRLFLRGTMDHGGKFVQLFFPGSPHRLELNYYPRKNRFYEPFRKGSEFDHFGFYVPNPEAWKRRVLRSGGRVAAEFLEKEDRWRKRKIPRFRLRYIFMKDPDGNWLEAFGPAVRLPARSVKESVPRSRD